MILTTDTVHKLLPRFAFPLLCGSFLQKVIKEIPVCSASANKPTVIDWRRSRSFPFDPRDVCYSCEYLQKRYKHCTFFHSIYPTCTMAQKP